MKKIQNDLQDKSQITNKATNEHQEDKNIMDFCQSCEDSDCRPCQGHGPRNKRQLASVALLEVGDDLRNTGGNAEQCADDGNESLHLKYHNNRNDLKNTDLGKKQIPNAKMSNKEKFRTQTIFVTLGSSVNLQQIRLYTTILFITSETTE